MGERVIGVPARKAWGMGVPEPTERPTKAIDGNFGHPQAPIGSLAPLKQQPGPGEPQGWGQHPEQKAIG